MAGRKKSARTQEERTAEMRQRLLDATIGCLLEHGYADTTTTLVALRAGVSRGAQLHHFRSKASLVRAAVEHLFERRLEEFRAAMALVPPTADRVALAIDLLWKAYSVNGSAYPWIEFVVAARTDPALQGCVAAMTKRIVEDVQRTFVELFADETQPNPFFEVAPVFAMSLMDGLALGRLCGQGEAEAQRLLGTLKQVASLMHSQANQPLAPHAT